MKVAAFVSVVTAAALYTGTAPADDKAACLAAASKGQRARDAHDLVAAREQFRVCAAATCPAVVQSDCATWLDAADRAVPTVVLSAKDTAGNDVFDVRVTVDGAPLATRLDGTAIAMNPGPHTFRFEREGAPPAERQVLVQEGLKAIPVAVRFQPATSVPMPTPAPAPALPTPAEPSASPPAGGSPWWTVGWIAGSAGLVGLGVGAAFGLVAANDKKNANCDANNLCDAGPLGSAKSAATLSDVGFIAGGLLVAGGVALIVLAPKGAHGASSGVGTVRLAPVAAPGRGGFVLGGAW
jgi:hypothetical protein